MSRTKSLLWQVAAALALFAVGCSSAADIAEPAATTETPRQVVPDSTSTSTSISTTTSTTTEPPPPPPVVIDALGSIRSLPTSLDSEAEDTQSNEVDSAPTNATVMADATVTSMGCTSSTGCAPTDLAAWAANRVDVVNLATSAAAADGVEALADYDSALLSTGVNSVGYGETLNAALEPTILRGSDRPIAIYSISLATDVTPELVAGTSTPGIAAGPVALDFLVERLADSLAAGQSTMVLVDWGQIDDRAPTDAEIEQIQPIIDVGTQAIVGNGSDFLQRFEQIDETAIAFNLGNAVTENPDPLRRDTAVFRLRLDEGGNFACLLPAVATESGVLVDGPAGTDCSNS